MAARLSAEGLLCAHRLQSAAPAVERVLFELPSCGSRAGWGDSRESYEVAHIQSENAGDAVDVYGRYDSSVVDLLANDLMLGDKTFPLGVNVRGLCEDRKYSLEPAYQVGNPPDRDAKAVCVDGSRRDGPKLDDVLRRHAESRPLTVEFLASRSNCLAHWVTAIKSSDENVRIDEAIHLLLVFACVDAFPADCLVG